LITTAQLEKAEHLN